MIADKFLKAMLQSNDYGDELGFLLSEQRRRQELSDRERDLSVYRSGSAPPTVEGSLSAARSLSGHAGPDEFAGVPEEELRSDPLYISYYFANVKLNPRLPPPLLSKEDWRPAQRLHGTGRGSGLGGIGDRRQGNRTTDDGGRSNFPPFPTQLGCDGEKEENKMLRSMGEWGGDGLIGLPGLGLGSRQKSIAEMIQEDISHATSVPRHPSHSGSCSALDDSFECSESRFAQPQESISMDPLRAGANVQGVVPNRSTPAECQTFASALGATLSRSTTPDPQLVGRVPSPHIPPVTGWRMNSINKVVASPNLLDDVLAGTSEPDDVIAALSSMSLSTNVVDVDPPSLFHQNYLPLEADKKASQPVSAANSYGKGSSTTIVNSGGCLPSNTPNFGGPNSLLCNGLSGYAINPAPPSMIESPTSNLPLLFENAASVMGVPGLDSRALGGGLALGPNLLSSAAELQNLSRAGSHDMDPMNLQYLRTTEFTASACSEPTMIQEGFESSYDDLLGLQKAHLGALILPQKSQYGFQFHGKFGNLNHNYYGSPTYGIGMPYPVHQNPPMGSCSPVRYNERNICFPSGYKNLPGGMMASWNLEAVSNLNEHFMSSLLDEFKSNKTKCLALSELAGHVVEFSADQYGSRFIQQKLENATAEEINMVFDEIMPQALALMTDVFGNYVIQKFFEHGTPFQIRELAKQLTGHVLTLSLQMYGCRVIQKAIEVVKLDQQKEMVAELDGHVMRCIRDQNGNHVIQKCIECIPEEAIQFVISVFYDQVVTLSTHPYGCRVIQRVLEHCSDPKTQSKVMDEIMKSVCLLTQDQYGNYVVQHVLEHGKPEERTAIINKLIGQIVQLSQQKFASNVVEKCLMFGTPAERQSLVNEMLGSTEGNEPLQVMMKDQFANYVVQKVLETCDDDQLESILNQIKVHLNALKKYTYGKHIVARVEKLVIAGERRINRLMTSYSA